MINILPTEEFTITTHLRPDRVADKLLNHVEPYKSVRFIFPFSSPPDKPYEGKVENGSFQMHKIYRGGRNLIPIIEGKIIPQDRGSLIEVKIKPGDASNLMILLPLLIIVSSIIVLLVIFLLSINNGARSFPTYYFIYPLWMGLGCFIVIINFKSQVKKEKKFLLKILQY